MRRTRIKICGITRAEDAIAAAYCGADAIGLILHANSPRRIELQTARQILQSLPPFLTPVGVFVDADPSLVIETARELGLRHLQLHGNEPPEHVAMLESFKVIKAIRLSPSITEELAGWDSEFKRLKLNNLLGFLIESGRGGSGTESDWSAIAELRRQNQLLQVIYTIAAGGLRAENVRAAIEALHPWAVDVSSGVEESMGIKSRPKISDFVAAVRAADSLG